MIRSPFTRFFVCALFVLALVGGTRLPALAQSDPILTPIATATPKATTQGVTPEASATPRATVTINPLPSLPGITAVQPSTIANTAETEIVITGSGFAEGATVILGESGSLRTSFVSSNLLRAVVPAGIPAGLYDLTVVNPDATSTVLPGVLRITAPAGPTATPTPTNTPAPTAFVRPLLVVNSYGASSAEITPNTDLDFEMTLANAGGVRGTNIVVTFVSGDFVARSTGGVRALGTLDPGQANRFWQPLRANGDLPNGGVATLEVKVNYTDANGTSYSDAFALTFPVRRTASGGAAATATPTPTATPAPRLRPQLIVTGYESSAERLEPGARFSLSLTVQNQGNAAAENVIMIVGGGTASGGGASGTPAAPGGVSGGDGEFTKFAPVGRSNVQTLGDLGTGERLVAAMDFIVNAATEPGAYPVKVSFIYEDGQNGDFIDDQVVTLVVVRRPSVQMNFYAAPGPFFAGEPGNLPLQVVNVGSKSAVLGNFSVTAAGATIESGSVFVGNLEPGGFYPLDAMIIADAEGALALALSINYTDEFGQPETISQTLTIDVMAPMVIEEPTGPPVDEGPAPEPETTWQKVWRFILGFIGLSSGRPAPVGGEMVPPGGEMPPGGEGPMPGESGPLQ